jgi:hypothetical protein
MIGEWSRRDFIKSVILEAAALSIAVKVSSRDSSMPSGVPLVAFRISPAHWQDEEQLRALLRFFAQHPGKVDELAFFTAQTHPPLPLEEINRRAERLRAVLAEVREKGMHAGVNVLATLGHHEENLENSLAGTWQRVMDPQGNICRGCFCPAQPQHIDYVRKLYTAIAQTQPDFIWIDDDVRLQGHWPVSFACFCDLCMMRFSQQVGTRFTRETLVSAFDVGTLDVKIGLRRAWLEHNRGVIDNLFRNIEEVVHEVNPSLALGFMTGDRFYEGYAFERWARTLSGPGHAPVRWRPGGGFYSDESPLGLVSKAHDLGRQVSALPPEVQIIESELENFPYQLLRKSVQTAAIEAAADMAAGTTATAFNVLSMYPEPLDEYAPLFDRISQYRPFYARLQSRLGRSRAKGIWPAWNRDLFVSVNPDEEWLSKPKSFFAAAYVLGEIGIPLCYQPDGGAATALAGSSLLAFSQADLRRIFAGGVLMDGDAWLAMKRLGLEKWTGVTEMEGIDRDATEVLAHHPLNGKFAGWSRDCRQSFWHERAYRLRPRNGDVEILASMVNYGGKDLGPCMTACTNELGGRVILLGYFPWSQIHSLSKSSQMKAICSWLSRDRVPVVVESFAKVVVWSRAGVDGNEAVVVLNVSLDPLEELSLRVLSEGTHFTHSNPTADDRSISADRLASHRGYVHVTLRDLAPWSVHLLVRESA